MVASVTIPIEVLYAVLILGGSLILLAWTLILHAAYRQWRWRRRQRRYGGDITERIGRWT